MYRPVERRSIVGRVPVRFKDKPWRPLEAREIDAVPGQLGVFELATDDGNVLLIGRADARSLFGLRSAIAREAKRCERATRFRYEVTTAYHSRHLELLMAHAADYGALPACNDECGPVGRLSPG